MLTAYFLATTYIIQYNGRMVTDRIYVVEKEVS